VRELNAIADYKWDEGMAQGVAIGEAKGKAEGKVEGRAEATRTLVARQLERKFGPLTPEHQALLDSATLEQLERYSDALLSASFLDEVFSS
jgi:flagellar biosynthesis/type III secretory pathway protein FliH